VEKDMKFTGTPGIGIHLVFFPTQLPGVLVHMHIRYRIGHKVLFLNFDPLPNATVAKDGDTVGIPLTHG
jgi:hypothetical protein